LFYKTIDLAILFEETVLEACAQGINTFDFESIG
jgi:hypothetical protein